MAQPAHGGAVLRAAAQDARAFCRRTWWVFLIGGIAAIVFGVLAFINPAIALLVLAQFFAAFVLIDGVANVVGAVRHRDNDGWWVMLLLGVAGVLVGGYALLNPPVSMGAFVLLVALLAAALGIMLLTLGYKIRKITQKEWLLYLGGAVSLLFGVLIVLNPAIGGLSVVWVIAAWAIATGVLRVLFAFGIRRMVSEAVAAR